MPRNSGTQVESTFAKGLVTEATGLNFPEGAFTSGKNVIPNSDGSIERRKGLEYELDYTLNTVTIEKGAVVEYLWNAVNGDGDTQFVVSQIDNILYFYAASYSTSLSKGLLVSTLNINDFKSRSDVNPGTELCSFASGKGYLFVTNKYCDPFYIAYNVDTKTFTGTKITVEIRDFAGVDDGLSFRERPLTLSDKHRYNLYNQGWFKKTVVQGGSVNFPITGWFTFFSPTCYPSNADVSWLFKDANGWLSFGDRGYIEMSGQSPAPKGYFILNAFEKDRTAIVSSLNDEGAVVPIIAKESTNGVRPSSCAFFAGRVFYSGVSVTEYNSDIYFSQIIENVSQIGRCYQSQDPTSENNSDLLASDGGVIKILDAGKIIALTPLQKTLIVWATNGIWSISGPDTGGFTAQDYTVTKISSITAQSPQAIVDIQGAYVALTADGVIQLSSDAGVASLSNISHIKIKSFLNSIIPLNFSFSKGVFDPTDKIVYWLYSTSNQSNSQSLRKYTNVLVFNTVTGAFYPYALPSSGVVSVIGLSIPKGAKRNQSELVVDNTGLQVTDSSGNTFIFNTAIQNVLKLLVCKQQTGSTYKVTWAAFDDDTYKDFTVETTGLDYSSEFFSGYKVSGEGNKEFQDNYITFYLQNITDSSAFVQGCWDFTNSDLSNKWTDPQQLYLTAAYKDIVHRKVKIRGWGKSIQLKIYSEIGKPFKIIGWSTFITGNVVP